jgi:hypothetical protein
MPAPAAPTGLTVASQNGSVLLNWAAPTNNGGAAITDYRVQRRLAAQPDTSFAVVEDGIKATPGATIACVNGTSYVFKVAAINKFGVSIYSANSAVVTPSNVPAAPAPPTCVPGNSQVTINWNVPANNGAEITSYSIQRKINGQTIYTNVGVSTLTSYTNVGLTNGTAYRYRVGATNVKGTTWSADSLAVTPSTSPSSPTISSINTVFSASNNNCVVNLSWTAPANNGSIITNYVIQQRLASNFAGVVLPSNPDSFFRDLITLPGNVTTASLNPSTISMLTYGRWGGSYVYRVAAINSNGRGSYSANSSVVTPTVAPTPCLNLVCTKGFNKAILNWTAPESDGGTPITSYVVERKISSQADTTYVRTNTGSSNTTFTATGLTNGTSYTFRVAAINARGQSAIFASATGTVIPGVVPPPTAPTNLGATIVNETGVGLTLTAPTDNGGASITGYNIQARPASGPYEWKTVSTNYVPGVSSPIDGFDDIPTIFRAAAVNSAGVGIYSANSSSVTPSNKLFDKASWRGVVSEPYFSYLNKAADRWYKYIKYNSTVRSDIAAQVSGWNGLKLNGYLLFDDTTNGTVAATDKVQWASLGGNKYNMVKFNLYINNAYSRANGARTAKTERGWVNTLTHELGHALGIGVFWQSSFAGSTPPSAHFLSGSAYPLTQTAYNQAARHVGPADTLRVKIPLEDGVGTGIDPNLLGGTIDKHWDDTFRSASTIGSLGVSYNGLSNELMIGWDLEGSEVVLSLVSIKHLVDLGWEEVRPGTSEGNPNIRSSLLIASSSKDGLGLGSARTRLICDCSNLPQINDAEPHQPQEIKINLSEGDSQ